MGGMDLLATVDRVPSLLLEHYYLHRYRRKWNSISTRPSVRSIDAEAEDTFSTPQLEVHYLSNQKAMTQSPQLAQYRSPYCRYCDPFKLETPIR